MTVRWITVAQRRRAGRHHNTQSRISPSSPYILAACFLWIFIVTTHSDASIMASKHSANTAGSEKAKRKRSSQTLTIPNSHFPLYSRHCLSVFIWSFTNPSNWISLSSDLCKSVSTSLYPLPSCFVDITVAQRRRAASPATTTIRLFPRSVQRNKHSPRILSAGVSTG